MSLDCMEFYSLNRIFGYGASFNFITSERGAGKTYSFKEWAIRDFLKTGAECAYVRRNPDEIAAIKNVLWDDIAYKFDLEIKNHGNKILARAIPPEFEDKEDRKEWLSENPWKIIGHYFNLAEQQKYKSGSYPNVNKLCFDEFIIESPRQQYIKNEVKMFMGLCDTIFRRRKGWKVVCLSNAGSIGNPYFRAWGVRAKDFDNQEFVLRNDGVVIFQKYFNQNNEDFNADSIIAKAAPQEYIDYAMGNQFADGGQEFVEKKPSDPEPLSKLTVDGKTWLTIYRSTMPYWWIGVGNPQVTGDAYSLDSRKSIPETIFQPEVPKRLKEMFNKRELRFQSPDVRELFLDWIG